jgi:hypothetical protein
MFAATSKMEFAIRILLITVRLFNALWGFYPHRVATKLQRESIDSGYRSGLSTGTVILP